MWVRLFSMWLKRFCLGLIWISGAALASERFVVPFQWADLTALRWDAAQQQGVITGGDQYVGFRYREGLLRTLTGGAAPGASDVALDPVSGDYFVVARTEGTLKFVSGRDFSLKTSLPAAAPQPTRAFYHPILKKLGSFNGPGTVTLFDVETTAYEGLFPLSDVPRTVVLSPDGRVMALLPERKELVLLNYRPFRILMRFPLPAACGTPLDLAVDSLHARFWLACGTSGVFFADYPGLDWHQDPKFQSAQRIFWDTQSLIVVNSESELWVKTEGQGEARRLIRLDKDTVIDWDHRFHRPVTATRRADPQQIELVVHTDLTLE